MKLGTRVWGLITVVLVVGILAAGWFLGASPLLDAQAQADKQKATTAKQNAGIQATINELAEQKKHLADYEKRAAELEVSIPSDIEAADFIRNINDLAAATGVMVGKITLGDATPYEAPKGEASKSELAPTPVTDGRVTGENFLLVPITISVGGGWDQVLAFTHGIQNQERLTLVTEVKTASGNTTGGEFSLDLSGAMYVLIRPTAPPAPAGDDADASAAPTAG